MNGHGGNREANSPDHKRDERLVQISNSLAEMSTQLTSLADEVRALQATSHSGEQQSEPQSVTDDAQLTAASPCLASYFVAGL